MDNQEKESNLQKVIAYAAEELFENPSEASDALDEDLISRIFSEVQFVSKEQLQKLWARVVNKSIIRPEEVSIDLIDFMKRITNQRAKEIAKLGTYVFAHDAIVKVDALKKIDNGNLAFWLRMDQLGIINGVHGIGGLQKIFSFEDPRNPTYAMPYGKKILICESPGEREAFRLECYILTELGVQVLGLQEFTPDYEYLNQIGEKIKLDKKSQKLKVFIADIVSLDGSNINYKNKIEL